MVAVKVLKTTEGTFGMGADLLREVEIMSAFDHDHILKLIGVVVAGKFFRFFGFLMRN